MHRKGCIALICASLALVCWLPALPTIHAASVEITEPFVGVRHVHRTTTVPRELDMHFVEIDPTAPGIDFLVTPSNGAAPGETVAQTTRGFLTEHNAQIAINGSFFESAGFPNMNVQGLSASNGDVYSDFQFARFEALNLSANNIATVISSTTGSGTAHSPNVPLHNAIGGDARLVTNGANTANQADTSLHPRTAVGATAAGKLVLFTVDGRNAGHSLGMSTPEVAEALIEFGVVDGINLDGGGSTTLVFADPTPRLVNVPVGVGNVPGTERAVGNNLAVFANALPESIDGDLNVDGVVDWADWGIFRSNSHTNLSGFTLDEARLRGDLDGDADNDLADFLMFRDIYDEQNGAGAFAQLMSAVPEPDSITTAALLLAAMVVIPTWRLSR